MHKTILLMVVAPVLSGRISMFLNFASSAWAFKRSSYRRDNLWNQLVFSYYWYIAVTRGLIHARFVKGVILIKDSGATVCHSGTTSYQAGYRMFLRQARPWVVRSDGLKRFTLFISELKEQKIHFSV